MKQLQKLQSTACQAQAILSHLWVRLRLRLLMGRLRLLMGRLYLLMGSPWAPGSPRIPSSLWVPEPVAPPPAPALPEAAKAPPTEQTFLNCRLIPVSTLPVDFSSAACAVTCDQAKAPRGVSSVAGLPPCGRAGAGARLAEGLQGPAPPGAFPPSPRGAIPRSLSAPRCPR